MQGADRAARTVANSSKTAALLGARRRGVAARPASAMVSAHAQPAADYKALVCIFFFGGNDCEQHDRADRLALRRVPDDARPGGAGRQRAAAGRRQRLRAPPRRSSTSQRLYNQQRAAPVFNVGTLVRPTTQATLNNVLAAAQPVFAFGPDAAVAELRSERRRHRLGRPHQRPHRARSTPAPLPPGITVNGGNALFLSGPTTRGSTSRTPDSFGLDSFGDGTAMNARVSCAAAAADVRQRPAAGQRRQRRARRLDPVGAGDQRGVERRAGAAGRVSRTAASASSWRRWRRSSRCAARSA